MTYCTCMLLSFVIMFIIYKLIILTILFIPIKNPKIPISVHCCVPISIIFFIIYNVYCLFT